MIHISAVSLLSGDAYSLNLGESTTIELLARYLAQYYTQGDEHLTLELAQPVLPRHRIDEIDIQAGDRLLMLTQPPRESELPDTLGPNRKTLTFSAGDYHVQSRGRRHLLLGKPDLTQGIAPHIDARFFISPQLIDYVSRSCLRFDFEPITQKWYVLKVGVTRVLMDDYELRGEPVPIDGACWLNFYRATDEPRASAPRSLGKIRLSIEEAGKPGSPEFVDLDSGEYGVVAVVGAEKENHHLNVNSSISAETIAQRLAQHQNILLPPDYRMYVLRLVAPRTALQDLRIPEDQFFYFGTQTNYAQNALILRDVRHRDSAYVLNAGEDKVIGYRGRMDAFDPTLHVDLYDFMIQAQVDPITPDNAPQYLAWLSCRASDNTWWIVTTEFPIAAIYLNNRRLGAGEVAQVFSGDVLTFSAGTTPAFENYFARFELEISIRAYNSAQHTIIG